MFVIKTRPVTYNFLMQRARKLRVGWLQTGGRNSSGQITSFKKGPSKYRRLYRFIDFWRRLELDAFIVRFEKDAFRSSTLTLVFYQTGYLSYVVLPDGYSVGDKLRFSSSLEGGPFLGQAVSLRNIAEGAFIFNVELWPLKGAQLCRAAGSYAIVVSKRDRFVTIKVRSGWKLVLSENCYATVGIAPNYTHIYKVLRKAGVNVNCGRRPTVRGVAMNAIDHPHGGGRGKTSGGPRPLTPWGKITKQQKTVLKGDRLSRLKVRFR